VDSLFQELNKSKDLPESVREPLRELVDAEAKKNKSKFSLAFQSEVAKLFPLIEYKNASEEKYTAIDIIQKVFELNGMIILVTLGRRPHIVHPYFLSKDLSAEVVRQIPIVCPPYKKPELSHVTVSDPFVGGRVRDKNVMLLAAKKIVLKLGGNLSKLKIYFLDDQESFLKSAEKLGFLQSIKANYKQGQHFKVLMDLLAGKTLRLSDSQPSLLGNRLSSGSESGSMPSSIHSSPQQDTVFEFAILKSKSEQVEKQSSRRLIVSFDEDEDETRKITP